MVTAHAAERASRYGERLSNSAAPQTFGTGRQCKEGGCQVLLSRYNPTPWCARHESRSLLGVRTPNQGAP
jgi:hypothetical protein